MTYTDWRMKGLHLKNCNCAFGCPCDFNAPPTYGPCEGMAGMHIEEGHFGEVPLDGLRWAATYRWPGPLHEGNGTLQPLIDERADEHQRRALLTILSGQEQQEGTFFHILSMIVSDLLEPQFVSFEFDCDPEARRARMAAPGIFETISEPIANPVTGEPHRAQVHLPQGFEYRNAEIASAATLRGTGDIQFEHRDRHSSLARVEFIPTGLAA